jgi:hypothetical protein
LKLLQYIYYHPKRVSKTLENDSMELINWFSLNLMKANPDKFQAIAIGKKNEKSKFIF